ncbi:MAG TPA: hypothetical protein VKU37_06635, partial [Verrucomicrobiae bacterium]|nr:hypothetical protein [Verrucomicrobiae bacterium]
MNYRVRRQGEDLGVFSLDELRRRREAGELTGVEYVQGEGKSDWQPLDLVLQQGYRVTPPPLPSYVSGKGPGQTFVWVAIAFGVVFCIALFVLFGLWVKQLQQHYVSVLSERRTPGIVNLARPEAEAAAGKPIAWTTNTLTALDIQKRARAFRLRQWLDGYEQRGQRNPECDVQAVRF